MQDALKQALEEVQALDAMLSRSGKHNRVTRGRLASISALLGSCLGAESTAQVNCRARRAGSCYHGQPEPRIYGEDGQVGDGTWNGESVVCDPCYIALGCPPNPVLA